MTARASRVLIGSLLGILILAVGKFLGTNKNLHQQPLGVLCEEGTGKHPSDAAAHDLELPSNVYDGIAVLSERAKFSRLPAFSWVMDTYFSNNETMKRLIQGDRTLREIYLSFLSIYGPLRTLSPLTVSKDPSPVDVSNLDSLCSTTWNGNKMYGKRPVPAKTVIFITMAYDLDALEFLLYETWPFMDTYVIYESHLAHHNMKSHAFFAAARGRFSKFMSKIVYFNDDDRELLDFHRGEHNKTIGGQDWRLDSRMRRKILEWYKEATTQHPDDLSNTWYFGGDPDEIPSKHLVARVKYCYLSPNDQVKKFSRAECMYRNNFEYIRRGEEGWNQGTLSMVDDILKVQTRWGASRSPMLHHSGMHVNRCTDPYTDVMKELTIAEGGGMTGRITGQGPEVLWRNPEMSLLWRKYGLRSCCHAMVLSLGRRQKECSLTRKKIT